MFHLLLSNVMSNASESLVVCVCLQDYLDALMGVCYDGVEGLLYLCLFSLLAACAFSVMLCAIPRAWRQIANRYSTHTHTPNALRSLTLTTVHLTLIKHP